MDKLLKSKRITDRFIEISKANELTFTDELEVLDYLLDRFKFKTVKHYADFVNKTPQSVYQLIEKRKIQFKEIDEVKFIF